LSGKVYTMADRPTGISEKLWKITIEQGKVESARGENILKWNCDLFESDEEFERFMAHMASIRAEKG